jgi:NAD(P)-dependent dehydrogenase (short-subunit alcohol dehydrogenase family)
MNVLVTGGSLGIGRAIAETLAARGDRVVLVARGAEALEQAAAAVGGEAVAFDVADAAAWPAAMERIGAVDALVCAAGVLGPVGAAGDIDAAEFARTLQINLGGTYLAIHHCLPRLPDGRGAIVTFSGGGATGPLPRYDAYAASKAAVVRLTENVAAVAADRGITVNAVAPGFVATRMHEGTLAAGPEAAGADYYARTQRDLEAGGVPPQRAADLVAFLLGPDARGITGKLLSAQWDPWQDREFRARLEAEPDLATLRRIDDQFFTAKR